MTNSQTFTIPGRLPGYNELKGRCWQSSMRIKREAMDTVIVYARLAKIKPVGYSQILITCYEPNRKRDFDNVIAGASKVILDALQQIDIIKGDGQKYIAQTIARVFVDKDNPRVEVEITEADNG